MNSRSKKKSVDSRYKSTSKIPVYGFPKDADICKKWLKAIPNSNLKIDNVSENMGVCKLHWCDESKFEKHFVKLVPAVPPNKFDVPKSCVGTPSAKQRSTQASLSSQRNPDVDELQEFKKRDSLSTLEDSDFYDKLKDTTHDFPEMLAHT